LKINQQNHQQNKKQESRAIEGRIAWCRCKFWYVSKFTV